MSLPEHRTVQSVRNFTSVTALLRLSCDKETALLQYTSDVLQAAFTRRFYAAVSDVSGRQTLSHVLSGCDDGYADEANRITKRIHKKKIPLTDNCSRNHFRCRIILCFCKRHVFTLRKARICSPRSSSELRCTE